MTVPHWEIIGKHPGLDGRNREAKASYPPRNRRWWSWACVTSRKKKSPMRFTTKAPASYARPPSHLGSTEKRKDRHRTNRGDDSRPERPFPFASGGYDTWQARNMIERLKKRCVPIEAVNPDEQQPQEHVLGNA